ncbi:MAG: hypothetical protein ACETVO_00285 [bacterium]
MGKVKILEGNCVSPMRQGKFIAVDGNGYSLLSGEKSFDVLL